MSSQTFFLIRFFSSYWLFRSHFRLCVLSYYLIQDFGPASPVPTFTMHTITLSLGLALLTKFTKSSILSIPLFASLFTSSIFTLYSSPTLIGVFARAFDPPSQPPLSPHLSLR